MKELLADAFPASAWRWGDDYLLEPGRRRLTCRDQPVEVDDRAFDLVVLLLQHRERALDKAEVIAAIWGKRPVSEATLRQLVYKARRAVGDDGERQGVISTLYGRSLQWIAPVEMVLETGSPEPRSASAESNPISTDHARPAAPPVLPTPTLQRTRAVWFAAVAVLVVVAAAGVWFAATRAHAPGVAGAQTLPRIAIAPVENATGDKSLDWVRNGLPGLLGSLLGQGGGVDVVDPLRSGRLWKFQPQSGRSKLQQLRFATGAAVLIGGRLRKLPGNLYELGLSVSRGDDTPTQITLSGEQPGKLMVNAAPRIRRALGLDTLKVSAHLPNDAFVAEAYSRGMDLAAHGEWIKALTHFKISVQNASDFLPARLQYGVALYRGDQMEQGEKTLLDVLARARQRGANLIAAKAMIALAEEASRQQKNAAVLAWLMQARASPGSADAPRLQARIAIAAAIAHADLLQLQEARRESAVAEALIKRRALHDLMPDLYGAQREIAHHAGDVAGAEAASRAQLAANEALGNERGALGSLMGLAQALYDDNQRAEAAKLFEQGYRKAGELHDAFVTVAAGDYLASSYLELGLDERVAPVADTMMAISRQQQNKIWQGLVLAVYGGLAVYHDDAAAQLKYFRQAQALIDAKQSPANALGTLVFVAAAAYRAEPRSLPALARQADVLVAAQPDPAPFRSAQQLIHALASAQAGKHDAAVALLHQAADGKSGAALDGNVRMISFLLGRKHRRAASIALAGFDPATWNSATDLRNYALWAASQGDQHDRQVAEDRIQALRTLALRTLSASVPISGVNATSP